MLSFSVASGSAAFIALFLFSLISPPVASAAATHSVCMSYTSASECLERPTENCYWCQSYCSAAAPPTTTTTTSSTAMTTKCTQIHCGNAATFSACTVLSAYSSCGWCKSPYSYGHAQCQYSHDGTKPNSCTSGWTKSTSWECASYDSSFDCTSSASYCGWCSTPSSMSLDQRRCQPSSTAMPATCTDGWKPYVPAPGTGGTGKGLQFNGLLLGLIIIVPLVCCMFFTGLLTYMMCRKPIPGSPSLLRQQQQYDHHHHPQRATFGDELNAALPVMMNR